VSELRRQLARGIPVRVMVHGFSLLPAIPPGARLEVAPAGPTGPRVGDLVVVEIGGMPVCHLLASTPSPGTPWVTRGLWAAVFDPPVPPEGLVGVVSHLDAIGLRIPATGRPFRAWLSACRAAAPAIRLARQLAWPLVPVSLRRRLRRGLDRGRT